MLLLSLPVQFSHSVMFDSATPWTAAHQASLSITNSWSLLKLMSTESVIPSNHLILCHPLLLLPSIFPSIRVFSKENTFPSVIHAYVFHRYKNFFFSSLIDIFHMLRNPAMCWSGLVLLFICICKR